MSVAYTAIAVVGLHVSGADVSERVGTVPSCGHEVAPRQRFCPDCGKRAGRAGPSVADCENWLVERLPRGLAVFQTGCSDDDEADFLVGVGVEAGDDDGSCMKAMPDTAATEAALRAALEPHGLWDASAFGLHAALYASV